MNITQPIGALALVTLAGCASTGVIPLGQDSYMIGKKDGAPGIGISFTNKAQVYQEAVGFCQEKSLEMKEMKVVTIPARPGQLGSTELTFKCVEPGDTAEALPDQIIEIRNR